MAFRCTSPRWLTTNVIEIQLHYRTKTPPPSTIPDKSWWIYLFAMNAFAREASNVFVKLQGMFTLLSQQRVLLQKKTQWYVCFITGIEVLLAHRELFFYLEGISQSESESWRIFTSPFCREGLHYWAWHRIESALASLVADEQTWLLSAIATMFLSAMCGIQEIVAEQDSENAPIEELPPALPHQIVKLKMPGWTNWSSSTLLV